MYAEQSGRSVDLDWYLTFAYFKLAVILQQIYAPLIRGQTADQRFSSFGRSRTDAHRPRLRAKGSEC